MSRTVGQRLFFSGIEESNHWRQNTRESLRTRMLCEGNSFFFVHFSGNYRVIRRSLRQNEVSFVVKCKNT